MGVFPRVFLPRPDPRVEPAHGAVTWCSYVVLLHVLLKVDDDATRRQRRGCSRVLDRLRRHREEGAARQVARRLMGAHGERGLPAWDADAE